MVVMVMMVVVVAMAVLVLLPKHSWWLWERGHFQSAENGMTELGTCR